MKTHFIPIFLASFLLLAWASAEAQAKAPTASPPATDSSKKVRSGKTLYDFQEVDILGQLRRPNVGDVNVDTETRFQRLLDLDESFLPNITRAVDEF